MSDLRKHRKDQAGLTNATLAYIYSLAGAATLGICQQFFWPFTDLFEFRLILVAAGSGILTFIYLMIRLGGADIRSEHRDWYVRFRGSLTDNGVGSLYARGVRMALASVDRFFGDGEDAAQAGCSRIFGLRNAAPLWTAWSYNRCMGLALLYPLIVVFFGWVASGEAAAVEDALGMRQAKTLERALGAIALLLAFASAHWTKKSDRKNSVHIYGILFSFHLISTISVIILGGGYTSIVIVLIFYFLTQKNSGIQLLTLGLGFLIILIPQGKMDRVLLVAALLVFVFFQTFVEELAKKFRKQGTYLAFTTLALLIAVIVGPAIALIGSNLTIATLLFFVGLLSLVNAPFDWVAIGMSRGLLRRGLERGGLSPLWLGLLDIVLSLALMSILAIAVLWASELFDWMATKSNNPPPIDPEYFLYELRHYGSAANPHFWWIFAMLFSTQIPALINLVFGIFCLLRGTPGTNDWMLARLPERGGLGVWQRLGVAGLWSAQLSLAIAIGLLGVYWLFMVILPAVDPAFGLQLVDWLDNLRILPLRADGELEETLRLMTATAENSVK